MIPAGEQRAASPTGLPRRDFIKIITGGGMALALETKAASPSMKITKAQIHHFAVPIENPVKASFGTMTTRHLVLLLPAEKVIALTDIGAG